MNTPKGILFDYGGTIDTNGQHWSEVLWQAYLQEQIPVTKEQFREAYVHAERLLEAQPLVRPDHDFRDVLLIKATAQLSHLASLGHWTPSPEELSRKAEAIALRCHRRVLTTLRRTRPVVQSLAARFPLALVTNFYGNIRTVLTRYRLLHFQGIAESHYCHVRKPDPGLLQAGLSILGCSPAEALVVGDSIKNDIRPAASLGIPAVWLKGPGWDASDPQDEALAAAVITDLAQLPALI